MKTNYTGTEENARNTWTTLCAKNGLPDGAKIGTNTSGLNESELHTMRKTARRALNQIRGMRRKTWTGLCRKSKALPVFDGTE